MDTIEWSIVIFGLILLAYNSYVKVPDVNLGLPSSLFTGRFKRNKTQSGKKEIEILDEDGETIKEKIEIAIEYSLPISEPLKEGVYLKPFWWKYTFYSRKIVVKPIERKDVQVGAGGKTGGSQGSVNITGKIQYRRSNKLLSRYAETGEEAVHEGLDPEIDFSHLSILRKRRCRFGKNHYYDRRSF